MDSELTELDDWVGTLAELQLGLERKCPSANRMEAYNGKHLIPSPIRKPSLPARILNPVSDPAMPPVLPPRRQLTHEDLTRSPQRTTLEADDCLSPPPLDYRTPSTNLSHSIRASFNPLSCREATAENDLNCLLRQLQQVEETMNELEQDDNDFTRRYSLASSSNTDKNTDCNPSPAPENAEHYSTSNGPSPLPLPPPPLPPISLSSRTNGHPPVARIAAPSFPPSPVNTKNVVAQRQHSPTMAFQSLGATTNITSSPCTSKKNWCYADAEIPAPLPPLPSNRFSIDRSPYMFLPQALSPGSTISSSSDPITGRTTTGLVSNNEGLNTSSIGFQNLDNSHLINGGSSPTLGMDYQRSSLECQPRMPAVQLPRFPSLDSSDGKQLQSIGFVSPHQNEGGMSSSLSNDDSSLSDKSVSDIPEVACKVNQVCDMANRLQLNKLVVRIFRPDKTTKAILIDQRMSAGEVASMLIEKNFLEPSIKLCLVEKVPSLKVERVFEEGENVAECILAWPARSQNMIFFESREDQFGFMDSPRDWLGESFAVANGLHSRESVQKMLVNLDAEGAPDWHDFLYIRKPGEKTWTRRMCVLRNSGLYTTKKNKKTFAVSDLIRLLVFDANLHIYTTTGGWSRMRAPTPHGFALKTYAAQDFSSTHVFCFCASDESSLRQWVSRLRITKYGEMLWTQYAQAQRRIGGSSEQYNAATQSGLKTLMRKSSLEVPRQNNSNTAFLSQAITHRQSSTGSLNFHSVTKVSQSSHQSISRNHPSLSPPLVRVDYLHNGYGGTRQYMR